MAGPSPCLIPTEEVLEYGGMRIDIFSLFPLMFLGPFQESILKRAQERDVLTIFLHQIRDYAFDRHQMTDDLPYGGGQGMVMKPEPIFSAVRAVLRDEPAPAGKASLPIILLSPQGRPFTHSCRRDIGDGTENCVDLRPL